VQIQGKSVAGDSYRGSRNNDLHLRSGGELNSLVASSLSASLP